MDDTADCVTCSNCEPAGAPSRVLDRDFIVEQLSWVRHIARQIHAHVPHSVLLEDLVSAGVVGLIRAADSFDKSRHVAFQHYAKARVRGAILDSLRELDWAPRSLRSKSRGLSEAYHELGGRLGRYPTETELADYLEVALPDLHALIGDLDRAKVFSLDDCPVTNKANSTPLCDRIAGPLEDIPYNQCVRAELRTILKNAIANIPEPARRVIVGCYFNEMTMKEVAARLGVDLPRVSRIHKLAIDAMRKELVQSRTLTFERPGFRPQHSGCRERVDIGSDNSKTQPIEPRQAMARQ